MKTLDRGLRGQSLAARISRAALIIVAAVGLTAPAWASGVHTHQEIVERAIQQSAGTDYYDLLMDNRGHVFYGSMFPDWGIAKGTIPYNQDYQDLSEVAHDTTHYWNSRWRIAEGDDKNEAIELPKFRQTLVAYAAPRPRAGSDAAKALAFLFGVISHQVADPAFHFDGCIPEKTAPVDCTPGVAFQHEAEKPHGSIWDPEGVYPGIGHTLLELYLDTHYNWNGIDLEPCSFPCIPSQYVQWEYPGYALDALMEAYSQSPYGGAIKTPPEGALEDGPRAQRGVYQGEMYLGDLLAPNTWAYRNIQDYKYGGMTEMVNLTRTAWEKTWELLGKYAPKTTVAKKPTKPDGKNGWYKQPVILTLTGEDSYLGVKDYGGPFRTYYQVDGSPREEYGGEPLVVSEEGQTTITLSSLDAFEHVEPPNSVVLKIDLTPPVVTVTPSSILTRVQLIQLSGHDPQPGSGLLSFTARLNQQPVTGQVIDPFWWGPGVYSLELTGVDRAGWMTRESYSLELLATLESLPPTVSRLCQQGFITQPGICSALSAKLDAALAARDHGNLNAMAGALNAFQNAVNAQAGKAISSEAAALLLGDSGYVLAH